MSKKNQKTNLEGQVALVTGASAGLGKHFAATLARAGANVAISARRLDRLKALADGLNAEGGGRVVAFKMDAMLEEDITTIFDKIEETFSHPATILVNNAGIPDAGYATKLSIEKIDQVLGVNLRAPFILSTTFARRLIEEKIPGRIVNIASAAAYTYGGNGAALYSITKSAMVRLTETLSVEWARYPINVNAIAPGMFESEMMDGMVGRLGYDNLVSSVPRKRICPPKLLESTLLYLVSPDSEAVTGTTIRVDDGQTSK